MEPNAAKKIMRARRCDVNNPAELSRRNAHPYPHRRALCSQMDARVIPQTIEQVCTVRNPA